MIDVSDGVASEVRHVCEESGVGALVYSDKIPISKSTINDAKTLKNSKRIFGAQKISKKFSREIKKDAVDFALYGGEDYELVFTAPKNKLKELKKYDVAAIGEIVDKKYGIKLIKNNKKHNLESGFDHFKRLRV